MDSKERWQAAANIQHGHEEVVLGSPSSFSLLNDPKHLSFVLARYKFVMKMLSGKKRVLELGSGDGIGLTMIAKEVEELITVDWMQEPLDSINRRMGKHLDNVTLLKRDPASEPLGLTVDAIFNIDFIEHIEPKCERYLMENIVSCLTPQGILITGTPNITASAYASESSKIQHINLKDQSTLRDLMQTYFHNVFIFGMNDEVLHTGFSEMCHFIWAIAVGPKRTRND